MGDYAQGMIYFKKCLGQSILFLRVFISQGNLDQKIPLKFRTLINVR